MAVWPAKRQVLLALADDFVQTAVGKRARAEPADGQVIAVVDQPGHGFLDCRQFVDQARGLAAKNSRR